MPRAFVRICALTLISLAITAGAAAAGADAVPAIPDLEPVPAPAPAEVPADLGPLPWDEDAIVLASSYEDELDPTVMAGCMACVSGSSCCCTASGRNAQCHEYGNPPGQRVVCSDDEGTTTCRSQGGCHCTSQGPGWVDPIDDPYTSN